MSEGFDIQEIQRLLPHRYPFLLVDRVTELVRGERVKGYKNVTINEPFFQGHFPERPVFPGVLILEAMAQASAILASHSAEVEEDQKIIFLFAGVDRARFKRPVEPGDQLVIDVEQTHYKAQVWKYATRASVDSRLVASAEVMFTYRTY